MVNGKRWTVNSVHTLVSTYPHCRLLLLFDTEAFLHTLDLAFEDTYFIDKVSSSASRLVIVKVLLEILASFPVSSSPPSPSALPPAVRTFVPIFIARNAPTLIYLDDAERRARYRSLVPSETALERTFRTHISEWGAAAKTRRRRSSTTFMPPPV